MDADLASLSRLAERGDAEAQRRLALSIAADGWTDDAKRWLIRAANGGDLPATTIIGRWMLVGRLAPKSLERGAAMIFAAAEREHPDALCAAAVVYASGLIAPPDWAAGLDLVRRAADHGWALAQGQLAALAGVAEDLTPPPAEIVSAAPSIWWVREMAPTPVLAWLIARAEGRLNLATVYDPALGRLGAAKDRDNTLFEFNHAEADLVVLWVRQRLAAVLSVPEDRLEASNVLHYEPGQHFARHVDYLSPDVPAWAEEIRRQGQRVSTALVYLNAEYEGGETEFPRLNQRFRGAPGDALFFRNVDAQGLPDVMTLHAGLPPTSGEKWLFSQFVRDRRQH